ncbi:MAG: tRNA lysidine(34) synthetase TilS [Candidatus Latescibacterota bacterium]
MPADLLQRVHEVLSRWLPPPPAGTMVVAVSGGLDSTVLLDLLHRLQDPLGLALHVAHLDHGLRPESTDEARWVAAQAARRGLPCTTGVEEVRALARRHRLSLEQAARQARYAFLDRVAAEAAASWIALGHQADDQAETVLLRLVRGSGSSGLAAMAGVRDGRYLRPLLGFTRQELAAYAEQAGLSHCEDPSNRDLRFARNRIRHQVLPVLQTLNPAVVAVLGRAATLLGDEDALLTELACQALAAVTVPGPVPAAPGRRLLLDAPRLLGYHLALQRRVIRAALEGLSTREGPFDFSQVERVLFVLRQSAGVYLTVAAGLAAQRSGDRLILGRLAAVPVDRPVSIPGFTAVPEHEAGVRASLLPASDFAALRPGLGGSRVAFDADLAGDRLRLRRPRPGDRLQPLGMTGSRKVSDILVDAKHPRLLRAEVLVLTRPGTGDQEEELLWLVGGRVAHRFAVGPETRRILLLEWEPKIVDEGRRS